MKARPNTSVRNQSKPHSLASSGAANSQNFATGHGGLQPKFLQGNQLRQAFNNRTMETNNAAQH